MVMSIVARQTFDAACRMLKTWAKKPRIRLFRAVWLGIWTELDAKANLKPEIARGSNITIRSTGQATQELQEARQDTENLRKHRICANT